MKEFELRYDEMKKLPEWPPKDEFDLFYSHRMIWERALKWCYDQLGYSQEHEELKDIIEKELGGE